MAKFGYKCKCGWSLRRGVLTRKKYALRKRAHATGIETDAKANSPILESPGCEFLANELRRSEAGLAKGRAKRT